MNSYTTLPDSTGCTVDDATVVITAPASLMNYMSGKPEDGVKEDVEKVEEEVEEVVVEEESEVKEIEEEKEAKEIVKIEKKEEVTEDVSNNQKEVIK